MMREISGRASWKLGHYVALVPGLAVKLLASHYASV